MGKILFSSQYSQVAENESVKEICDCFQVVVPVFQRGYCWEETQLEGWWKAVIKVWQSLSHPDNYFIQHQIPGDWEYGRRRDQARSDRGDEGWGEFGGFPLMWYREVPVEPGHPCMCWWPAEADNYLLNSCSRQVLNKQRGFKAPLSTHTLLLLRDKLKGLKEVDLCREANKLLVSDVDFLEEAEDLTKSRIQSKLRLLPSQPDRWIWRVKVF